MRDCKERGCFAMDARDERYIECLRKVRALAKPEITPGMKAQELLGVIQHNAAESFRYMKECNALLDERVFSQKAEDLTEADAADLLEFAKALFQYANSEDCGIAYCIHKLLLQYARLREDEPMIIRELYNAGVTLHYLNVRGDDYGINPLGKEVRAYFQEGASYMDRYESFDLETKGNIIRCLGNSRMAMSRNTYGDCRAYLEVFNKAMKVICSPYYRALDPSIPWDNFEYSMHMDRMTLLGYLRNHEDPEIAQEVLRSAEYVYKKKPPSQAVDERVQNWRIGYSYKAARFHAGVGTAREVVDELLFVAEHTDQRDYSPGGINNKLVSVAYLFSYEQRMTHEEREQYAERVEAAFAASVEYLNELPVNQYPRVASAAVRELVEMQAEADRPYRRNMLIYMLAAHKPTYVHSLMVANLTRYIVRKLTEEAPAALVGVMGCESPEEVQLRAGDLCMMAYECGLYHDIGKSMVTMYIGINSRRLLDEEFRCVQWHTVFGYELLCKLGHRDDWALAALYHHMFYDGTGGYPKGYPPCPAHFKGLVDALTVADSMDAATDDIGRCYTAAKSVETLIGELRAQRGSRYAPAVVALFDDPDFCTELKRKLYEARQSVYLEVYHETNG